MSDPVWLEPHPDVLLGVLAFRAWALEESVEFRGLRALTSSAGHEWFDVNLERWMNASS